MVLTIRLCKEIFSAIPSRNKRNDGNGRFREIVYHQGVCGDSCQKLHKTLSCTNGIYRARPCMNRTRFIFHKINIHTQKCSVWRAISLPFEFCTPCLSRQREWFHRAVNVAQIRDKLSRFYFNVVMRYLTGLVFLGRTIFTAKCWSGAASVSL